MKTHWKKQHNYDYMGSYSLPDGQDVIMTIKATKKEDVTGQNGKKQECFVVYFTESDKPMIMNRTNCKAIEKVANSPYVEDWIGKRVQIGIDTVSAFGESVDALRVRRMAPKEKSLPELTPNDPKWADVVAWVKSGGSVESVRSKYKVSEEVMNNLKEN